MYDHRKQLKCAIIRARAISDVDNLLPKYATVIDNLCPLNCPLCQGHFELV